MTFADYAKRYEASLSKKAAAAREDYCKHLKAVWSPTFGERLIHEIRYSELEEMIGNLGVSAKTLDNYLIPLRGVFAFAVKDGAITKNPAQGIENAKVQKPHPDPFEQAEIELIIEDLAAHAHVQVANYFAAAFFGGFCPSEQIAIQWKDVDFKRRNVRVQRAVVRGQPKESTNTYVARDVELTARAWAAF